jgi:heme exporter protein D
VSPPDLAAGKYALFIWPAYGVTALAFAWMILDTLIRGRRWRREVQRLEQERSARDPASGGPSA